MSHFHSAEQIFKHDIPNVFRIFARDINILVHRPLALIIALGIAFLPSLYAWVNIYANWDPYGNTGNLKVAVASNDTGYSMEGVEVNLGDNIISNLRANDAIGWQFVPEDEAREGVRAGEYYAAVIIPDHFSNDVATFITSGENRPTIEYFSNEKKNAIASKITSTGINTLQGTINEQFVNTLSASILDVLHLTDAAFNDKSDAVIDTLMHNLEITQKNLGDFSVSVDLITSTAVAAQDLTAAAQALLPDLDGVVTDNLSALESLRALTQSADKTGSALSDVLDQNITVLLASGEQIYDSLEQFAADGKSLSADAADTVALTADAAYDTADAVDRFSAFLSSHKAGLVQTVGQMESAKETIKTILGSLPVPLTDTPVTPESQLSPLQKDVAKAIDNTLSNLYSLSAALNQAGRDLDQAARTLRTDGALPAEDLALLRADLKALRTDLDTVKQQYTGSVSPLLSSTLEQFYVCIDSLSGLLLTSNQNLPALNRVMDGVDSSLSHSIDALSSSKVLIANAQKDLNQLIEELNSVEEDARLAKLIEIIEKDPGAVADFISSPVSLETNYIYPVENYGSSMTPFYSILAIWVGGLLMCSIFKTDVKADEKIKNFGPTVAYFGRYCLFALIAILQALIICLGDLYILHIQCLHPALFVLTGVVAAIVYSLMMYTLTVSFKDVGKAIAVIIMVVQVAGSGGTFPAEVLPHVFQIVNPILPFTFCIDAMRECIAGMYGNALAMNLIQVSAIYIPISLLIGVVLRRPVILLMNFFEHQVEKTGLM